jgi:RHS repeat-associated protein
MVTGTTGNIIGCHDYLPFGQEIPASWGSRTASCYSQTGDTTIKFTGQVRDTDTTPDLDYFGARYFSSAQGRWMSPDWADKPEPVPYGKLNNPQSLNLYGYVLNNAMSQKDDDGHEIIYADGLKNSRLVGDTVQAMLANPHTSGSLSGYVGPNNPNLIIQSGDLSAGNTRTVSPDGKTVTTTTVQGNTAPDIQTTASTENGVTSTPVTTLVGATITIDNKTSIGDTPGVMVHEGVHAGEALANPAQFLRDARAERSIPQHDQRPQEQRAKAAQKACGPEIKKAVTQTEKDRKKEQQ